MSDNKNLPGTEIADRGTHNGIRWWVTRMERIGLPKDIQYNGYVELPDNHPIMIIGATYSVADKFLDAHRGITYSQGNIVGFDTNHTGDSEARWPAASVRNETLRLSQQVHETNIEEYRHIARQALDLRNQIKESLDELENLGFSAYGLDIYL